MAPLGKPIGVVGQNLYVSFGRICMFPVCFFSQNLHVSFGRMFMSHLAEG